MLITSVARYGLMRKGLVIPQHLGSVLIGPVKQFVRRLEKILIKMPHRSGSVCVISVVVPGGKHTCQLLQIAGAQWARCLTSFGKSTCRSPARSRGWPRSGRASACRHCTLC
jgi:hypothetical protein